MTTKTTITLGDVKLDAFRLEDGSYASPGLYRLVGTDIYFYSGCWYCLNPDLLPDQEDYNHWDSDIGAFLSFEGNKLSYLYIDRGDAKRGIDEDIAVITYAPVPKHVYAVVEFCDARGLLSGIVIDKLYRALARCYPGPWLDDRTSPYAVVLDTALSLT